MPNLKFSQFDTETTTTSVTGIVGYNTTANKNIQITPANFINTTGGPYLPLAGGTMIGNTIHNDNVKSIYGTASDGLEIFYDGANTNIDAYNGNIIITNNKDNQDIIFKSDDGSGDVIKYFLVNGGMASGGTVYTQWPDNSRIALGSESTQGDLNIYHDSTDSFVNNFTGDMYIQNAADDKDIIFQSDDGSGGVTPYFYLDGGGVVTRFEQKLRMQDSVRFQAGSSGDFSIRHNGVDSYLENETGDLYIKQNESDADILLQSDNGSGGETTYVTIDGANVRTKFSKNTIHTDSIKANFGSGSDLSIYHDGDDSYIDDTSGTGSLYVNTNAFRLVSANKTENMFSAFENAQVQLYYNNSVKLATTTEGVDVTGKLNVVPASGNGELSIQRVSGAQILLQAQASAGVVGVQTNDRLDFKTNGATRMSISNTGDVGIGTTSPGRLLTLSGSTSPYLSLVSNTTGGSPAIFFGDTDDDNEGRITYSNASDYMALFTAATERIRINSSGNVGIGTTVPTATLHIESADDAILRVKSTDNKAYIALSDNDTNGYISSENSKLSLGANLGINANNLNIDLANNRVGIGVSSPVSKLEVDGGDIEIDDSASGLILRSPDGTRYRVTVANGGAISASAV